MHDVGRDRLASSCRPGKPGFRGAFSWAGGPTPAWAPVLAVFLLALALRSCRLTYHSLWFDEAMSTFWAARPAAEIWRVGLTLTQDKHPPLYYLMLHLWMQLLGAGDAPVRALGVLLGALAVFPVYGIGVTLSGRRAGLIAGLLVALNPFLVWYSQEARMFMPATTLALFGISGIGYWLLGVADGRRSAPGPGSQARRYLMPGGWWTLLLAMLGFTAALYTYLFSAFLLPVAAAWLLLGSWLQPRATRPRRRFWLGAGALAIVGILFLPLARAAWTVSGGESQPGRAFADMGPALWRLLQVYAVGWPGWPTQTMTWTAISAGGLAVLGLVGSWAWDVGSWQRQRRIPGRRSPTLHRRPAGLFLALWLFLPLLVGGLFLARDRTVFAETRYFIFLVPALCLAWGLGLSHLWEWQRPAGLVALALVMGVTVAALPALWSPQNRREAWREAAGLVQSHAGPNDAVLIQPDYIRVAFERYFDGPQPIYFPFTERLADASGVGPPLEGLAGYDAVWLVQSHHQELDPGNLVAGWFGARYPLITEAYPAGIVVKGFAQHYRTQGLPSGVSSAGGRVGDLRLLACEHERGPVSARDDLFHPPSGWVHVTSYWTVDAPLAADVFPDVRLVDAAGQVWGEKLDRPGDAIHIWPTSRWLPGEVVRLDYDVNLNPVTPAGEYRLLVQVAGGTGGVVCGDVKVH